MIWSEVANVVNVMQVAAREVLAVQSGEMLNPGASGAAQ
jgi:hypothetical protein